MSSNQVTNKEREHQMKKVNNFMFDLYDQIGAGFSSKVYKGKNCEKGCQVAIKVIELKKLTNNIERMLIQNQVRALKAVKHPNLLPCISTMQTVNNLYIVTPLYQQNLQSLIQSKGKFAQSQVIYFLIKMTQALCYLQSRGIIHRDIKPSNIFISRGNYVLGDFGFCCFLDTTCKENGYNVGSPLYMSPQAYKNSIYSHQSDIWSLAVCVLELILGQKPFIGICYDEMLNQVCQLKFYRNFNISESLKNILDSMFAFCLEKRCTPFMLFQKFKANGFIQNNQTVQIHSQSIIPHNRQQNIKQHKRSVSISVNQNQKQNISFKNIQKVKINGLIVQNKENQKLIIKRDSNLISPALTQRNINHPPSQIFNQHFNHPPNQKIIALQNLGKLLLLQQVILKQNPKLLKLFRIACICIKFQFSKENQARLWSLPQDSYFQFILQTINPHNIFEISHYLTFLMQSSLQQFVFNVNCNEISQKIICKLKQMLHIWSHHKQQQIIQPSQIHSNAKVLDRAKSKSVGNFVPIFNLKERV